MPDAGFTAGPTNISTAPATFSGGPNAQPFDDVIELLPVAAQDRLRKLRQRAQDAASVMIQFQAVHESSMGRIAAENALHRLTRPRSERGGHNLPRDDRRVIEAVKTVDKLTDDFERLKVLQTERAANWTAASQALAACETWLRHGKPGNTVLEVVKGEVPKPVKGESLLDAIERMRRRCRELRADLHRIQSAPYPSSYCKQQLREQVAALSLRGAVSVSRLVEHDGPLDFQTHRLQSNVFNAQPGAVAFAEVVDAVALIAWLHKDAMLKRIDAEIDAESDDGAALSHEAREKAEAEVQGDLLDIERSESELVWMAQHERLPCEHRSDCSPLAILGVRLVTAPRAAAAETSAVHATNVVQAGR